MPASNIIPFPKGYANPSLETYGGRSPTDVPKPVQKVIGGIESEAREEPVSIDSLYPSPDVGRPELTTALRLLKDSLTLVGNAIEAIRREDYIAADDEMQRLQVQLTELFCCRDLGDGFTAIVNAIQMAFRNKNGTPFSLEEMLQVRRSIYAIRSEPFLSFDNAMEEIFALENAGLNVDLVELDYLTDIV